MAADMFLKITGIDGESGDDAHGKEIEVLSWSWGATQTADMHSGSGGGTAKANVQDVTIHKYVDSATPTLFQYCLKGTHIEEAILAVRKAGGSPLDYLTLTMQKALISSVQTGGSGGEKLMETLTLNFGVVKMEYKPQTSDGAGDAAIPMGFDIQKNKPL